jgi:hypothetical protein
MMRKELELRNLPRFRIMEYLIEAGGAKTDELGVAGPDWSARLEAMEPAKIITMTVRRDLLIIEGEDAAVEEKYAFMRRKTMRGGG